MNKNKKIAKKVLTSVMLAAMTMSVMPTMAFAAESQEVKFRMCTAMIWFSQRVTKS